MNTSYILKTGISISLGLFVLFTVLPVKITLSSLSIILLLLVSLIQYFYLKPKLNYKVLILTVPFFIYLLGLINTQDLNYGGKLISKNLSFLVLPLVFTFLSKKALIDRNLAIKFFLIGLSVTNIYLIYLFVYYFNLGEKFSRLLTDEIYHSTYLGMYNVVAFWLCYLLLKKLKKYPLVISFYFVIAALMCSSRTVAVLALASVLLFLYIQIIKYRWVFIIAILSISIITIRYSPSLNEKFIQLKEINKFSFDRENYKSISSRFAKIEAATQVIKKNKWFGTGTGDLNTELQKEYKEMRFSMGIQKKYNPHNQYLENWARNGLIGGSISLMFLFLIPLYYGIKNRCYNLIVIVSVTALVCLTESVMTVHKGITFYVFFSSLFFSNGNIVISKK